MLRISWIDKIKKNEVLTRIQTKLHFHHDMHRLKQEYSGHVLRSSGELLHINLIEDTVYEKMPKGRPDELCWMEDIKTGV